MNIITCICLGVRDMGRSVAFCRDELGFKTDCVEDSPCVCFFDTPGTKFELYSPELLAEDIRPDDPLVVGDGFGGITLAYNVARREEVGEVIELVRAAGGTVVKEPQEVFWGGYHAYFADVAPVAPVGPCGPTRSAELVPEALVTESTVPFQLTPREDRGCARGEAGGHRRLRNRRR